MRSLSDVTRITLTNMTSYWLALWALAGTVDLALSSSVELVGIRVPLMLFWLSATVALLAARFLPGRARVPALLGITLVLTVGTVVAREMTGLLAPWFQVTMAGGLALTAMGFVGPTRLFPVAIVLVMGLVLLPQRLDEVFREDSPVHIGVPIVEAALVVGLGLLAALIRAVLTLSSRQADESMEAAQAEQRAAVQERWEEEALAAQMNLLHDTALNTLNAIALTPGADVEEQRRRCAEDARRLREVGAGSPAAPSTLTQRLDRLQGRAVDLGMSVDVEVSGQLSAPELLPDDVVQAMVGAIEEALINVAKHAGVDHATVQVRLEAKGLHATVTDHGMGFDPSTTRSGYGMTHSIRHRMAAAGGAATIASAPGVGTTVTLDWDLPVDQPEPAAEAVSDAVARLMAMLIGITAVFTAGVVVAEWQAFERPLLTLLGGAMLGGWGLAVARLLIQRRSMPASIATVTVLLACTAPFWTVPADLYCASTVAGLGWIDARIPLIVMVTLTVAHWWQAAAPAPAFIAATMVAGTVWGGVFTGCEGWAVRASSFAVAIFVAALMAGRGLRRQVAEVGQARRQQREAEEETLRATAFRAERQRWFEPAVASCVPLLASIGEGAADPGSDEVRRRCRDESGYLRGLVAAAQAPAGVRNGIRELLNRVHRAGADVEVRGDLAGLPAPLEDLGPVLLARFPDDLRSGTAVSITGIGDTSSGSLMVHAPGVAKPSGDTVRATSRSTIVVDDLDGLWLELSWTAAADSPPVARR